MQRVKQMPLVRQIFVVDAVVLGVVALLLIASPLTITSPIALNDALVVLAGLLVSLIVIRLSVGRLLAPMHRLADAMREVDPRDPDPELRRYVAPDDGDVDRLLVAFEQMLDRFRIERLESDRRMVAAQDSERRRIAREVHDELGQTLTALSLQIERSEIDSGTQEALGRTVDRALDDVRGIARRLRPEALDDLGLVNALIALVTRVSEESGLPIQRRIDAPLPTLPPDAELTLYRVAQESLTNVIRHAQATRATLTLRVVNGTIVLTVSDDGRGFSDQPPTNGGIAGMRERARLIGTQVEVSSIPGRGTNVQIQLNPIPSA